MVMVLMMDRELAEFLAVKFTSTVCANPGKKFEGKGSIRLFAGRDGVSCHKSYPLDPRLGTELFYIRS